MKPRQVEGINAILDEWESRQLTDMRWLAYALATTYHETAKTMWPIEEFGKGKGKKYGKPDSETGLIYYGRGFVQLTWKYNYANMSTIVGADLVHKPELALDLKNASVILIEGMLRGSFTGKKLSTYINADKEDWPNARRIINGLDKATMIAGYARNFWKPLSSQ
jgi:hypothetical protein